MRIKKIFVVLSLFLFNMWILSSDDQKESIILSSSEMALGYGSEYQLLRFLGYHRNYLNKTILTALNLPVTTNINWLDYPINLDRKSLDGELKDIECFQELSNFKEIEQAWKEFWPNTGSAQNWDGIFKIDDTWYFVEAKAHEEEIHSSTKANSKSKELISKTFQKYCSEFSSKTETWINSDSYQLANRIAFIQFCKNNGIKAKLVYISFINGYEKTGNSKSIHSEEEWKTIWDKEYKELGLDIEKLNSILTNVYIDCKNIN